MTSSSASQIIRRAIEQPLRTLVENAGGEGSVVVNEVKNRKGNEGYNVATGEYVDLIKAGVVDPTKVTRTALQNAASISGLLLTTEAVICELPEKEKPAPRRRPWWRPRRHGRHGLLSESTQPVPSRTVTEKPGWQQPGFSFVRQQDLPSAANDRA